ncbi:28832_t:CDS:2, partial [Gigaspora margarita]
IHKAFTDKDFKTYLQKIDTLIIEEISMVSAKLLDFISNLFARLHNNTTAFGGINVIVVATWSLFYPLFLQTPQYQNSNTQCFKLLEEV